METLIVERERGVVTVTMNRPARKNALDAVMVGELLATFEAIERDDDDRVLVLGGAGGAFCSGADLADPQSPLGARAKSPLTKMRRLGELALALHQLSKPTIAKVEGYAVGAGMSLAMGCDLVLAAETARFSLIFARRGLSLDFGASYLLPRLVGMARAKELALLADVVPAGEALAAGLVNRVVAPGDLDQVAAEWASRLAAGPPIALSLTKMLLRDAPSRTLAESLEAEAQAQAVNFATADTAEALRAFLAKREPRFEGR